jgi:hypothetical protein
MSAPEQLPWNPRRLAEPPVTNFTRPSDAAMPACVKVLAGVIGAETAALPSIQRRICLDGATGELLLLLDVPLQWHSPGSGEYLVAPEPGSKLDAWLAFAPLAFPVETAVELLRGGASPELELSRRRQILKTRDEIRAAYQAEKDAKAEAERKEREEAEARKTKWREPAWDKLLPEQRLALSLSLAIEARDPALAADLRQLAALSGGFLPLPRTQWWLPADQRTDK